MKQLTFAAMLALASMGTAFASPASDAAQIHFTAIGSGDTSIIMRGYGTNPQLIWVGGPLDGMYAGDDAIRATWEKFGKAVGPARVTVLALEESANPKGATIVAKVQFDGKAGNQPLPLPFVLLRQRQTTRQGLVQYRIKKRT